VFRQSDFALIISGYIVLICYWDAKISTSVPVNALVLIGHFGIASPLPCEVGLNDFSNVFPARFGPAIFEN
jgi:membrane-bound metal-dependent hydrolase YbcI (DUF457 family)